MREGTCSRAPRPSEGQCHGKVPRVGVVRPNRRKFRHGRKASTGAGCRKAAKDRPVAMVTGGAGFLGSHVCDRLMAEGAHVICVDNLMTGRRANVGQAVRNWLFLATAVMLLWGSMIKEASSQVIKTPDFGVYDPDHQFGSNANIAIEHTFVTWTDPDASKEIQRAYEYAKARNRWLMLTIEPWFSPGRQSENLLADTLAGTFKEKYGRVEHFKLPVMITELGVDRDDERKRAHLSELLSSLGKYPLLRAVFYFNAHDTVGAWPVDYRPDWHLNDEADAFTKTDDKQRDAR